MIKYMTSEERARFWQAREESRRAVDKALASRSFTDKLKIMEKMKGNHEAMIKAGKRDKVRACLKKV